MSAYLKGTIISDTFFLQLLIGIEITSETNPGTICQWSIVCEFYLARRVNILSQLIFLTHTQVLEFQSKSVSQFIACDIPALNIPSKYAYWLCWLNKPSQYRVPIRVNV